MKYQNVILKNRKLIAIIAIVILLYIVYLANIFTANYNNKEIKALKVQIEQKEKQFKEVTEEKQKLQDSSARYEQAALKADQKVTEIKQQVITLQKEKAAVMSTLNNLPKEVIDSFFRKRYIKVEKVGVTISLYKNIGNEVVKELTEKDFLASELDLTNNQNKVLTGQVDTLKISLNFSKQALIKADTAINVRTQQFQLSQNINQLLKKDLKKAKHKAFWGNIKGTVIGAVAGIVFGKLAH
jgi:hypothetical protein